MCKLLSTEPCNNCPYRKDAPLRLWDISEFVKLLQNDVKGITSPEQSMGQSYGCHKNNGNTCVGWLVTQLRSKNPSVMAKVTAMSVDAEKLRIALESKMELYASSKEMIIANYPNLKGKI